MGVLGRSPEARGIAGGSGRGVSILYLFRKVFLERVIFGLLIVYELVKIQTVTLRRLGV
jgi:hypothetical protein